MKIVLEHDINCDPGAMARAAQHAEHLGSMLPPFVCFTAQIELCDIKSVWKKCDGGKVF